MEKTHTKGDWSILDTMEIVAMPSQTKIGRLDFISETDLAQGAPEMLANGKLMAAAPDLLKALQDINRHWSEGNFSRETNLWEAMDKAIKKATK